MKKYIYHHIVCNQNNHNNYYNNMNIFKKIFKKIKKKIFYNGKEFLKDIEKINSYPVKISNIDFFTNKNIIHVKNDDELDDELDDDSDKEDSFVKLIDIENYSAYYRKNIVAKILYKRKKTNKILLTFNKKENNIVNTIYKASIEFHFFLSQCVISKNTIFIQISVTGLDDENNKFKYFSNKIALINNVDIEFDTIFHLIKENFIDKYNFNIDIKSIDLYTYFIYNNNISSHQENEINLCMNKYYSYKKHILHKNDLIN